MATGGDKPDLEKVSCSICLDLLKDPVTIPCGHNYCMNCVQRHWDKEDGKKRYSCPQCRRCFKPRPVLCRNTMLADLVEKMKKTEDQAAAAEPGPADVACDLEEAASAPNLQDEPTDNFAMKQILSAVTGVDVSLQQNPMTSTGFSQYSLQLTLDPNTVSPQLVLSEGNQKVRRVKEEQSYPPQSDRFMSKPQVLSLTALPGRCYWEVEWSGLGVSVAVAYKTISRTGDQSRFGADLSSWALECRTNGNTYTFLHNGQKKQLSGPQSSRIGVFLDHRAGLLMFYDASDTRALIHRVQTTFTQPLYAGLEVCYLNATAELCT